MRIHLLNAALSNTEIDVDVCLIIVIALLFSSQHNERSSTPVQLLM
jgi:hypothetical protein